MTQELRLLSRTQLRALRETGLHDFLRRRHTDEVGEITAAVAGMYPEDKAIPVADLETVIRARMQAIAGLEDEVVNVLAEGGLSITITSDELWEALALWVVETQLVQLPRWDATSRPGEKRTGGPSAGLGDGPTSGESPESARGDQTTGSQQRHGRKPPSRRARIRAWWIRTFSS